MVQMNRQSLIAIVYRCLLTWLLALCSRIYCSLRMRKGVGWSRDMSDDMAREQYVCMTWIGTQLRKSKHFPAACSSSRQRAIFMCRSCMLRHAVPNNVSDAALFMQDMNEKAIAEAASRHPLAACSECAETVLFACRAFTDAPCNAELTHVDTALEPQELNNARDKQNLKGYDLSPGLYQQIF